MSVNGSNLEELLSQRLKAHEENLKAHRVMVEEQRKWLTGGATEAEVPAQGVNTSLNSTQQQQLQQHGEQHGTGGGAGRSMSSSGVQEDLSNAHHAPEGGSAVRPQHDSTNSRRDILDQPPEPRAPMILSARDSVFDKLSQPQQRSEKATQRMKRVELDEASENTGTPTLSRGSLSIVRGESGDGSIVNDNKAQQQQQRYDGMPIEERLMQREKDRQAKLNTLRRQADEERRLREEEESQQHSKSVHRKRSKSVTILAAGEVAEVADEGTPRHESLVRQGVKANARQQAKADLRRQMIEQEELATLVGTPRVSANSHRLAMRKREKDGCADMDIADSLLLRDEQSKQEKWLRIQHLAAEEVPGRPVITKKAAQAALDRSRDTINESSSVNRSRAANTTVHTADVSERLYNNVSRNKSEQLRELVEENLDQTFQPAITPRAHHLQRKEGHTVSDDLYDQAMLKYERQELREQRKLQTEMIQSQQCNPTINPISEMIVSKMQESTQERLCRPKRSHQDAATKQQILGNRHRSPRLNKTSERIVARQAAMNQSVADSSKARGIRRSGSASPSVGTRNRRLHDLHADAERRQNRRLQETELHRQQETAGLSFTPSITHTARDVGNPEKSGTSDFLDRAEAWQRKRQQKLYEQRENTAEKELQECTFEPELSKNTEEFTIQQGSLRRSIYETPATSGYSPYRPEAGEERLVSVPGRSVFNSDPSELYGGDGKAWGYNQHLDRQEQARRQREEQEAHKAKVFSTGVNWKPHQKTVPQAPQLGLTEAERRRVENAEAAAIQDEYVDSLISTPFRSGHAASHQGTLMGNTRHFSPLVDAQDSSPLSSSTEHNKRTVGAAGFSTSFANGNTTANGGGIYTSSPSQFMSPKVRQAIGIEEPAPTQGAYVAATAAAAAAGVPSSRASSAATSSVLENARKALQKANALSATTATK